MVRFPKFLHPFKEQAESYLEKGLVKDIEFSDGTYQVQVEDAWAFLQLDHRGQIKDCFCSCREDETVPCVHISAAYLRIYQRERHPLHIRFRQSLWNQLCRLYAEKQLKYHRGRYEYDNLFYIKGKTARAKTYLKQIIEEREEETEETSIKFSNLPQEEILLWKEGRPSLQLRYELSLWSDIAKWMMLHQDEGKKYRITFSYSKKKLPEHIRIEFEDFEVGFHLSEANLPLIIPSLITVKSPLSVHHPEIEVIRKIRYDKKNGELIIDREKEVRKKEGYGLNGWMYITKEGFYSRDQYRLLSTPKLSGRQVAQVLNEHFDVVKTKLEGTELHEEPVKANYTILFDKDWKLHINCYVFEPGDLSQGDSQSFGNWVYLDRQGFYRLDEMRFETVETVIPSEDVTDFVQQQRTWLNMQEGFQTHVSRLEAKVTYSLNEEDQLTFSTGVAIEDESLKTKDFGPWVYVEKQGFYTKKTSHVSLPVQPGIELKPPQIPLFIRANRQELQLVPGFFSKKCSVASSGLNIEVTDDGLIAIRPQYELQAAYQGKDVRFFEEFTYVKGEGFYEMSADLRLPERYRQLFVVEQENIPFFIMFELKNLKECAHYIDPRLIEPVSLRLVADQIVEEDRIYTLQLSYQSKRGNITISDLWPAIKKKERFYFSDAGLIDLADERFNWLRSLPKKQLDRRNNKLHLSTMELLRLNAFDELEAKEGQELLEELLSFRMPEKPDLTGLMSHLRPYQHLGVQWLWFLYNHKLSGMLCDEMGLGKTHQAMALIAATVNQQKKDRKFLIICPTSVIFHWQEKLEKFLPTVRVCTFHGSQRSLGDFHKDYDVLLTSYGIWRNENKLLSQVPFEIAIFDEIQAAKNKASLLYASLLNVKTNMRLGLTGTPIENRLRELKALFDIVLPTYMLPEAEYRRFYIRPIEQEGNADRKRLLYRYIQPFILRRKKKDVLPDLPEKTEEVSHCELSPDQVRLYTEVLSRARDPILRELQDESHPIPYIHIFAVLSSLKQICNHPAAFLKRPEEYKNYESGKWDLFVELLSEARESGQKVVIYSQYLNMLDIIENHLKENGIAYATIRGATRDRGKQVHRFNQDPNCEVFVGSLQAAGWGIDLTAASVVIHYDRWWNAAREDQATDRVHRIGQTRGVEVFKLVTKKTFEDRIDELITEKGKLMEEVIGVDDHRIVKKFDRYEIMQLLHDVESYPLS